MALLTPTEFTTLEQAIAAAETRTRGEIVVAVLRQSDDYQGERLLNAVILGFGISALILGLVPGLSGLYLLTLLPPILLGSWFVLGAPPLMRALSLRNAAATVHQRALRLFTEQGITETRDRSGLLIMLSELEQRVILLGDSGLHTHVGDPGWEEYVERIVTGIKAGAAGSAVLSVLEELSDTLATHFPARADDTNELSNEVIQQ
jgi:putative membrane protein